MRTALFVASIVLVSSPALAGRTGGSKGGGGGGRLGAVSSGIQRATSSSSSSKSSSVRDHRDEEPSSSSRDTTSDDDDDVSTVFYEGSSSEPHIEWPDIDVDATGFAGGQKVIESDGSLTAELGLVFDRRVRIAAGASHYFEETTPTRRVSMTVPSLTVGLRLSPADMPTRVWLDGGVVHVRTNDPEGSSAITGTQFNARVEHDLGANTMLLGQAGAWLFDDLQAITARAALRVHHVEVGVRYVDFTVGPPLWGPEIGVGF